MRNERKKAEKALVIDMNKLHNKDTGSSQVQVAILKNRINLLQKHALEHPKDKHSKYGLKKIVSKLNRHVKYVKRNSTRQEYESFISNFNIRDKSK